MRDDPLLAGRFDSFCDHLARNGMDLDKQEATLGARLALDPKVERFFGNAAADALLTRVGRPPFVLDALVSESTGKGKSMSTYSVRLLAVLLSLTVGHIVSARAGSSRPATDVVMGSSEVTTYPFPAAYGVVGDLPRHGGRAAGAT